MALVLTASFATPASRPATLTRRVWDIDWEACLPWRLGDITVNAGTFDHALPFMRAHYEDLFGTMDRETRFTPDPLTGSKKRFGDEMDVFVFRSGVRDVGLLIGHPLDWSTYYLRSMALLPQVRDQGVVFDVFEHMYAVLRTAGVERMDTEVSPCNVRPMRALTRLGWIVTGTVNSDRWGTMLRLTKFLCEATEGTFARQFCGMRVENTRAAPSTPITLERRPP